MSTRRVTLLALSTLATAGLAPISSAHAATGTTIYVGQSNSVQRCSDNGPGSAAAPFCTFPEALAAAGPGDTIGVYYLHTEMDVTKSGTPGSPITIKPVPDSFGRVSSIDSPTRVAVVDGQHDIVIEGFTASGADTSTGAFAISGTSTRVTIADNRIGSTGGSGVSISGGATGNVVAGNSIGYSHTGGITAGLASGTVFPDALTGGAYAANAGIPLLLTDPRQLPANVAGLLGSWQRHLAAVEIFGGPAAVSTGVQAAVAKQIGGRVG